MQPKVSVISSFYNCEKYAEKFLECLANQTYKNFELIILQDKSSDKTEQIVKNTIRKRQIKNTIYKINESHLGIAETRNRCIKLAKGDIIVNIDSDCYAEKEWLKNIIKHVDDKTVVMGKTLHIDSNKWSELEADAYENFVQSHIKKEYSDALDTRHCAFKRSVFEKVGYFDPQLKQSEDKEFGIRLIKAGYKIYLEKNAVCYHNDTPSLMSQFRKAEQRATSQVIVSERHHLSSPRHVLEGVAFFFLLFLVLPVTMVIMSVNHGSFALFLLPGAFLLLSIKTVLKEAFKVLVGRSSLASLILHIVIDGGYKYGHLSRMVDEI